VPYLHAVPYLPDERPTPEQEAAQVLVVGLTWSVEPIVAFMHRLPHLELVQTLNAGYDQWEGRLPAGVILANARGAHGRSTAEWAVAGLLNHLRALRGFAEAQSRRAWEYRVTDTLDGKRVAVIGAGDIGSTLRRMLEPFGATVTLVARTSRPGVLSMDEFQRVRGDQDVVILAVPVTPDTVALVDKSFLAALKDGTVVVNAGRGVLVDTSALVDETRSGRLQAMLDVTEPEPLPADHPLWTVPGVTITPHVAGSTAGLSERAWSVALAQLEAFARGQTPDNLVIG
jgi:phosphoglycerate dehydrogenase-like enzyme